MGLSRLDNFLKNVRGNILYVNPNDLDATDSIENQGNSMGRPFLTIQRALIEAARFSYQRGLDNDRFGKTTILLSPGIHTVDNRPGWIPIHDSAADTFQLRDGTVAPGYAAFSSSSNFDLDSANNDLYKLNSVYGGVIVPRGTSIVASDLRKTKIRPKYVPDPTNDNIGTSALFRVTGDSYFFQFSIFDGDPLGLVYKNYTTAAFVPNFSHHKLTAFEFADGVNKVSINDAFISNTEYTRTDLEMYYEKVGLAYGPASGRNVQPDFPSSGLDIQPKIDEYRIVGPTSGNAGISSIFAGNITTPSNTITVQLQEGVSGLNVDTRFLVNDVSDNAYNGSFLVDTVETVNASGQTTRFTYKAPATPTSAELTPASATITLDSDTVTSASPYIFNVSIRSVYGMCGLHADGSKATGFQSMVAAQFTGVSLQKDDNAFVRYNTTTGSYDDSTGIANIHSDDLAKYKPAYTNYHIKASNNAVCQLVSIFAIGYAQHFVTESGGDFSVTNSNSNFGQISLASNGYRDEAFRKDDVGYITNIIPPQSLTKETVTLEFGAIDVATTVGAASSTKLYLYQETNEASPPPSILQGYRVGAKTDDDLSVIISIDGTPSEKIARIVMPNTENTSSEVTSIKVSTVGRNVSTGNSISNDILTFEEDHNFINGETVRVVSDNARLPDGIIDNRVYFAITTGVNADQIKLAATLTDSLNNSALSINKLGGKLKVQSRVSDKNCGDIGHPVQYDSSRKQWYITVSSDTAKNNIYATVNSLGTAGLGAATARSFITRTPDFRGVEDRIYKMRLVIPASSASSVGILTARAPRDAYVLVESSDSTGSDNDEVALQFSPTEVSMSNETQVRNFRFLKNAIYDSGTTTSTFTSELPHNLSVGTRIKINNVTSTENTAGVGSSAFNQTFTVATIPSSDTFTVSGPTINPGTYTNNNNLRTTALPSFNRVRNNNTYYIYDVDQVKEYISGEQAGIYYLTVVNSSNTPSISPFNIDDTYSFSQPISKLYPQTDRDNPVSDPESSKCYALSNPVGEVVVDEVKNSITKETLDLFYDDLGVGVGITDIVSNSAGTAHTIFTNIDHGLQRITKLSLVSGGSGYGNNTGSDEIFYNATLGPSTTGDFATARVKIDTSHELTSDIKIMNGGSGFIVGDVLTVTGIATTTSGGGFTAGTVRVDAIMDNVGDTIRVSGITSDTAKGYNTLYRITGLTTTSFKEFQVESASSISSPSTIGIGADTTANSFFVNNGPTLSLSSGLEYERLTGLATVRTSTAHGLRPGNTIEIGGATNSFYNGSFVVKEVIGITTFIADLGITTVTPSLSGTLRVFPTGTSDQSGNVNTNDENFGGRTVDIYGGVKSTLQQSIPNETTTSVYITNLTSLNLNIGDYLMVDDEIMRVKTTVGINPITVFRGLFGTKPVAHLEDPVGSGVFPAIKRILVKPVELRRPSIIRASGHTFEYIGYGPGNYSTALPDKQGKQPTLTEQLISQKFNSSGGISVYTGMNDRGDFYIGNKKISATTGKEEVFSKPIPTVTGEDVFSTNQTTGALDVVDHEEMIVKRKLTVDGGPQQNILSEFDGPVVFNKKITSTTDEGIESNSIFLQGDATVSRKYTVGIATPTVAGNPGDVVYNATPSEGGTLGWTYTTDNAWYAFGAISIDEGSKRMTFDRVGVGTTTVSDAVFKVQANTTSLIVDEIGVGVGATALIGSALQVGGVVVATAFTGDGSGLTNIQNDSKFSGTTGVGQTGIFPINNLNVGIGTSVIDRDADLEVGDVSVAQTALKINNESKFIGTAFFSNDVFIPAVGAVGILSVTGPYNINSSSGGITVGVATATTLVVGTALSTSGANVGLGTETPRAKLDIVGETRFEAYSEIVQAVTSSSGEVDLDLSKGQNFEITTTENITAFNLLNITSGTTRSYTIKITQDSSTPYTVDVDTYRLNGGSELSCNWPGGIVPTVTNVAGKTDIYSFMTFDGGTTIFGVVGGQNFS